MARSLDRFVLSIPYPLLKKCLYSYLGAIVFWMQSLWVSLAFLTFNLIVLLVLLWQSRAWTRLIQENHNPFDRKPYIERLRAPARPRLFKLAVAIVLSSVGAYILDGLLGFNSIQLFLLSTGYFLLYRESAILGNYVIYMTTDQGIGIAIYTGHFVYRTFLRFDEIKSIQIVDDPASYLDAQDWLPLIPQSQKEKGMVLSPIQPGGFSTQGDKIFISPRNRKAFLERIPAHLV